MKKEATIGIDVGGTNIKAVLFDGKSVISEYELATPKDNYEHFIIMTKAVVDPLLEKAKESGLKVNGIGLGAPATIDPETNVINWAHNLGLIVGHNYAEDISHLFELPTRIENDASCFVRAEAIVGAAKRYENVFGITLGTGIGGGWWINEEVYQGANFGAGEPGHMIVDLQRMTDIEDVYKELMNGQPAETAENAYRGDRKAQGAYEELGRILGVHLANIANLIDPEAFVVGGRVADSADLFMPQVKKNLYAYIKCPKSKKNIQLFTAKLGAHAGAIGAALLVTPE
jgi:glucokinase